MHETFPSALASSWRTLFTLSGVRRGAYRALAINLFVVLAFGVLIPRVKGVATFDPVIVFAFSFVPLLYAVPGAADLVSRYTSGGSVVVCARIIGCALYAWTILAVIYALAMLTVNIMYRTRFFHPAWPVLGSAALFGFFSALFAAAATATLAVLFSPSAARNAMRFLLLAGLLALLTSGRWMPESWSTAIMRQHTPQRLTRAGFAASGGLAVLSSGLILALAAGWKKPRNEREP